MTPVLSAAFGPITELIVAMLLVFLLRTLPPRGLHGLNLRVNNNFQLDLLFVWLQFPNCDTFRRIQSIYSSNRKYSTTPIVLARLRRTLMEESGCHFSTTKQCRINFFLMSYISLSLTYFRIFLVLLQISNQSKSIIPQDPCF